MSKATEFVQRFGEQDEKTEKVDVSKIIAELIKTSWGGSNEEQMKAVQLLKGVALSEDPRSNKFMKALDDFTSKMNPDDYK